jgi:hypothetical protein
MGLSPISGKWRTDMKKKIKTRAADAGCRCNPCTCKNCSC